MKKKGKNKIIMNRLSTATATKVVKVKVMIKSMWSLRHKKDWKLTIKMGLDYLRTVRKVQERGMIEVECYHLRVQNPRHVDFNVALTEILHQLYLIKFLMYSTDTFRDHAVDMIRQQCSILASCDVWRVRSKIRNLVGYVGVL